MLIVLGLIVLLLFVVAGCQRGDNAEALAGFATKFTKGTCESTEILLEKNQPLGDWKQQGDKLVDKSSLPKLLGDGYFVGSQYSQYISFEENTTGYIDYLESDLDVSDDYLYFVLGVNMVNYRLVFGQPSGKGVKPTATLNKLGSKYEDYWSTPDFPTFVGQQLEMFGVRFKVVYARIPAQHPYSPSFGATQGEKGLVLILKSPDGIFYHLIDKDISDDTQGELWVSSSLTGEIEKVVGIGVLIKGTPIDWLGNQELTLDEIEIIMHAQDDYFVNENGLGEAISNQNDNAELLFPNNLKTKFWDIRLSSYDSNYKNPGSGTVGAGFVEIGRWC